MKKVTMNQMMKEIGRMVKEEREEFKNSSFKDQHILLTESFDQLKDFNILNEQEVYNLLGCIYEINPATVRSVMGN